MFNIIDTKIGIRIALFVNLFLFIMIILGAIYIYIHQTQVIEAQILSKGKSLSIIGAKSIGKVIEGAVENGIFSEKDAFDTNYELIPGFVPPKYHTRYDSYLDKAILSFQDEFLKDDGILYATAMDANGYIPTHNSRFQKPFTGNQQKDYLGNRTKRIFNDPITVRATQNKEYGFLQPFEFDSKYSAWDISTPVFVNGKYWGCFRIGYKTETSENAKQSLIRLLFIGTCLFLIFSASAIFFIVNRSLKPLVEFTQTSLNLADGDVDRKIEFARKDEIGQVAEALERLRVSLKAAMERLMRR